MAEFDSDIFDYSNAGFIRADVIGATMIGRQAV
jgi:hypothetical protein